MANKRELNCLSRGGRHNVSALCETTGKVVAPIMASLEPSKFCKKGQFFRPTSTAHTSNNKGNQRENLQTFSDSVTN
jgi:hypothetical protein